MGCPNRSWVLRLAAAGLLELDLGHNALTRLPPELAACTALTRLALDGNEDLVGRRGCAVLF